MIIKPCPFCGGKHVMVQEGDSFRWRFATCCECGARSGDVRVQTLGKGTKPEWEAAGYAAAIEEWNTRAALAGEGETK